MSCNLEVIQPEEVIREVHSNFVNQPEVQQISQINDEPQPNNNQNNYDAEQQQLREEEEELNRYVPQQSEQEFGYDMIIQMKSVFDLQNKTQDSDHQNVGLKVQQFKQDLNPNVKNVIIVGMQGQRNKGKTFILNSLINEDFPSDFHVSTPGICIKLHSLNNKNIVYVDSEGLGCPITIDFERNVHYQKFMENKMDRGIDDTVSQENLSIDIQNRHQDLKATEQIQQEFIIDSANILIIVVSYLTLDDQKLIHSISQKFVVDKQNPKQKKLLVVHNLKEYRRPEYIKTYMNDLKKIFPISEQPINTYDKTHQDENNMIFVDNINPHINHLIMGHQKSEAGRVYNKFCLYFLKQMIQLYQGNINFNVQQKLMEYLDKHLQTYVILKSESDDQKQNPIIQDFLEFNKEKSAVMLKSGYQIERVKELQVNVFGSLQKDCQYSIVNNDQKKERYVLLEVPGSSQMRRRFDKQSGQLIVKVTQNNNIEEKHGEIQVTTRKLDEKLYKIQICKEKELWNIHHDKQENLENGVYKFVFTQEAQDDFDF